MPALSNLKDKNSPLIIKNTAMLFEQCYNSTINIFDLCY